MGGVKMAALPLICQIVFVSALLAAISVTGIRVSDLALGSKLEVAGSDDEGSAVSSPAWTAALGGPEKTTKPLIGLLSQACHRCPGKSYVAAAYVKWIESAGGRAVPIRFYQSDDELHRLFKSVNGIIFPGGLTDLWLDDPYVVAARKLWNWAQEENDKGNVFPIWGTCLGHQLLQILSTNTTFDELLIETDAVSQPSTLEFTETLPTSRLFGSLPADLLAKLGNSSLNLVIQNHEFGVPPSSYEKWPLLKDVYNIVSYSTDRNGLKYISTIEAKQHPFFGTQWHPEKPPYEFSMDAIPHGHDSILVSQHLANVFINLARYSAHKPESVEEELAMLIYNYKAIFTAKDIVMEPSYDGPDITYFFDPVVEPSDERLSGVMGVLA